MVYSRSKRSVRKKIQEGRNRMTTTKTTKTELAIKLGISRSSLYYKCKKPPSDDLLKNQILEVMKDNPAYGHKRVAIALKKNRKRIRRVMNKYGLRPRLCRRRKVPLKPEDVGREEVIMPNVLNGVCIIRENVVWAGDFTYILFWGKFWFVATIIDVFTREVIGWYIADHHTSSLIIEALRDAVNRTGTTPIYFHSDQGSEYVSGSYSDVLQSYDILPSMSKKSCPWQNGFQESFYNNFKLELENPERFKCIGQLIEAIYQQIDYYNNRRIHTSLNMPPVPYRELQKQKQTASAVLPTQLLILTTANLSN